MQHSACKCFSCCCGFTSHMRCVTTCRGALWDTEGARTVIVWRHTVLEVHPATNKGWVWGQAPGFPYTTARSRGGSAVAAAAAACMPCSHPAQGRTQPGIRRAYCVPAQQHPPQTLMHTPQTLLHACRAGHRRASARWCAAIARCCCRCSSGRTTRACAAASTSCTRSSWPWWCAQSHAFASVRALRRVCGTRMQSLHGSAILPNSHPPSKMNAGSLQQGTCRQLWHSPLQVSAVATMLC